MSFKMRFIGWRHSKYNNKYKCVFDMYRFDDSGQKSVTASSSSAAVWSTQEDAEDAGTRAVLIYEETGMLPNLCEKW